MKIPLVLVASLLSLALLAADELAIARAALRDGLWDVARIHAEKAGDGDEARLVILESFAREGKWKEIVSACKSWGEDVSRSEPFACALAEAYFKLGEMAAAETTLDQANRGEAVRTAFAERIRAEIAISRGDFSAAVKLVSGASDVDSMMVAAQALDSSGDRKAAERKWRGVVASTNADENALATASANLNDEQALRLAYSRTKNAETRRFVGLRLGRKLIESKSTFAEGEGLIRAIVKDAPDTEGAREAFCALADANLASGQPAKASEILSAALEMWPETSRDSHVQQGRGWAFLKLGKTDEALAAFVRAEELAADDDARATAILKQGDALSEKGQGAEAMARYRMVLEKYPKTVAARLLQGFVNVRSLEAEGREHYRNYRFADAQKAFETVAAEDPARKPRMDYFILLCLYGQGRDEDAEKIARRLADEAADFGVQADATLWLAKLTYNRGKWADAAKLFVRFADRRPDASAAPEALVWASRASLAANDFQTAIATVTRLVGRYPDSPAKAAGLMVQGEALIELARFDEAVLVLEQAALSSGVSPVDRLRALVLKADALFAMGADNPARYFGALDTYSQVRLGEALGESMKILVAFKIGRTLEKLKRTDEAIDEYYAKVVLAYRDGRANGVRYDDEARAAFSRAAFRLADEYESRGKDFQAVRVLELVATSDVPAADEAEKRINRIERKGKLL